MFREISGTMKKYPQFHQIASLLLIFVLLIANTGCVGFKVIPSSNLPVAGYSSYKIKTHNSYNLISNAAVINGILSGKIDSVAPVDRHSIINVYISSDSVVKFKTGNILSIPLESITRVEEPKPSVLLTSLLIGGVVLVFVLILNSITFDFNPLPNGV